MWIERYPQISATNLDSRSLHRMGVNVRGGDVLLLISLTQSI